MTGREIKRKRRKIQAPKDLKSLEMVDYSKEGNSTFVSHQFCKSLMYN